MDLKVLYEDNHLIAVYKPAGVLAQGDETGDKSLMDFVKDYLKRKYNKAGNVFLGLIHRLDRPVSGVVLFAKTSKGASRLSEQFREHSVDKIYHALVEGKVEKQKAELRNLIIKDEARGVARISDRSDAKTAVLNYELVKYVGENSLLKIKLDTGRFHQIRLQLSDIGHPIVGDRKYGAKNIFPDGHIELCASTLCFKKAVVEKDGDQAQDSDLVTVSITEDFMK